MMMRRNGLILAVSATLSLYGQSSGNYSTAVQVAAWTTGGVRIAKVWISLTPTTGTDKIEGSGNPAELTVPTGDYMLRVTAPGFVGRSQLLSAYQPKVFRSVTLSVFTEAARSPTVKGTIRNYKGDLADLRIRLMGLYGDELRESLVDTQGSFHFPAEEGAYILLVIADQPKSPAILDIKPLYVVGEQNVSIDLKTKRGKFVLPPDQD